MRLAVADRAAPPALPAAPGLATPRPIVAPAPGPVVSDGSPPHTDADTLAAYNRGELPAAAAESVRGHLSQCAACRAHVDGGPPGRGATQTQVRLDPLPANLGSGSTALAGLPDYEIVRQLGQGGMGAVYLARN